MSEDSASPRAAQPSQAPTTGACAWCGAAMELGPQARARFCCSGCEAAAAIVDEAGLDEWWRTREAAPPRPGGATGGWEQLPVQQAPDGSACATLRLDGLRCGSCVWLVERVLRATPGVEEAQVSYASGHTALRWRPEQVDLPQLCARIQTLGYTPRPADSGATPDHALLLRLGLASFAAMNVMMLAVSVYLGWWQGMDERYAALMRWASLILATPVVTWAAQPFFAGAWAGLRHRMLHMDLPISLGIGVLYGHGLWSTLRGQDAYLDSLTMLVALLLGGRLLEQRGRSRAAEAAASLAARAPRLARRVGAQGPEDVPAAELRVGDLVEVPAGGEVPADGVVEAGRAAARLALLTGESEPRELGPGEPVVTGAVLLDGSLRVRVQAVGDDTLLARMARGLRLAADRPAAEPQALEAGVARLPGVDHLDLAVPALAQQALELRGPGLLVLHPPAEGGGAAHGHHAEAARGGRDRVQRGAQAVLVGADGEAHPQLAVEHRLLAQVGVGHPVDRGVRELRALLDAGPPQATQDKLSAAQEEGDAQHGEQQLSGGAQTGLPGGLPRVRAQSTSGAGRAAPCPNHCWNSSFG